LNYQYYEPKRSVWSVHRGAVARLSVGTAPPAPMRQGINERMVDFMIEKIMILHELKLAGFDISENLEKMYQKYGKEEFQRAARISGYGFILK
jgi:hypothetical protein